MQFGVEGADVGEEPIEPLEELVRDDLRASMRSLGYRTRVDVIAHLAHRRGELLELLGREHAHEVLVEVLEMDRHRGLDALEAGRGERCIRDPAVFGAVLSV